MLRRQVRRDLRPGGVLFVILEPFLGLHRVRVLGPVCEVPHPPFHALLEFRNFRLAADPEGILSVVEVSLGRVRMEDRCDKRSRPKTYWGQCAYRGAFAA